MNDYLDTIDDYFAHETQRSTEAAYPTNRGDGRCWRCCTHPTSTAADLCVGCRSFLLGDTNLDPISTGVQFGRDEMAETLHRYVDDLAAALNAARPYAEAAFRTVADLAETLQSLMPPVDDELHPVARARSRKTMAKAAMRRGLGHSRPARPPRLLRHHA